VKTKMNENGEMAIIEESVSKIRSGSGGGRSVSHLAKSKENGWRQQHGGVMKTAKKKSIRK